MIACGRHHLFYLRRAVHGTNRLGLVHGVIIDVKADGELAWWAHQLFSSLEYSSIHECDERAGLFLLAVRYYLGNGDNRV